MTLQHTAFHGPDDRWHAGYPLPGFCNQFHSIGSAITSIGATRMAQQANAIQAKQAEAARIAALAPADRPLVRGFYTDKDAA